MIRATRIQSCLGGLAVFSMLVTVASADVPRLIQYQGKLLLTSGAAVPGPVSLRVRLYDQPTGSTNVLFDETHAVVTLTNGLFSILLGSQTGGAFRIRPWRLRQSISDPQWTVLPR